jgi:hypothetical protein
MSKLIAFLLFVLGIVLMAIGIGLPPAILSQTLLQILWKALLGFLLVVGGFLIADSAHSAGLQKFMAIIIGLSGIGLLATALLPTIVGFPLFSTGGIILRVLIGIVFCVIYYVISREFDRPLD